MEKAQLNLEEYRIICQLIEEIADIGYWEWDIQDGSVLWSRTKCRIYGEEDSSFVPSFSEFEQRVDQDTLQRIHDEIARVLSGQKPFYDLQHPIRFRDGRHAWVHEKAFLRRNAAGEPIKLIGVVHDITQQKRLEAELEFERDKSSYIETHDLLTRLPNRRILEEDLVHICQESTPYALVILDISRFSLLNTTYGHHFGDTLLARLAREFRRHLGETSRIYRYGTDEFAFVTPEKDGGEKTAELLKKLREIFHCHYHLYGTRIRLDYHAGIGRYPQDAQEAETLIAHTYSALEFALQNGQIREVTFQPFMKETLDREYHLFDAIEEAIQKRDFQIHYQPIFDAATDRIVGLEALLRWPDGAGDFVPLDLFLPIAREEGLIHRIDALVMEEALKELKRWRDQGFDLELSVNVHLDDFSHTDTVALLKRYADVLKYFIVEISEKELLTCSRDEQERLDLLRSYGVQISIDDFGTGYSSLHYLRKLSVDEIKIDRSFLEEIPGNPQDEALIGVIRDIAEIYGVACVVEGIETPKQREFLLRSGLRLQQGYLLARPMPSETLEPLLRAKATR